MDWPDRPGNGFQAPGPPAGVTNADADSALLHAMRASALQLEVARQDALIRRLQSGPIVRIWNRLLLFTGRMRHAAAFALLLVRVTARSLREGGPRSTAARVRARLTGRPHDTALSDSATASASVSDFGRHAVCRQEINRTAPAMIAPRVLILAELTVPQCAKYRVWQKKEHFERLGVACTVVDWRRTEASRSALQTHALAILYRVPLVDDVRSVLEEAQRLRVKTYWEVDDLIFDRRLYVANGNLATLAPALRENVLRGVDDYRKAMLACDGRIASTAALAQAMDDAGAPGALVIENALDRQTLEIAAELRASKPATRNAIVVAYGSGTLTHDIDFRRASPALLELMARRPNVRLCIIGELGLPQEFRPFSDRVERVPSTNYRAYLGHLAEADVSIAPLEDTVFNDAKSGIKFLEASILGLPSVCSPRRSFRTLISHGKDGFLADDDQAWLDALLKLADDSVLRSRIGEAARQTALRTYAPGMVAQAQVAPLVDGLDRRAAGVMRVLQANIFFKPQTYGGATVVAEAMARCLNARSDIEVSVFSSCADSSVPPYGVRRYVQDGITIFGVRLPDPTDDVLLFDNPEIGVIFRDVLMAVQPAVVHFHSLQGLSASIVRACREVGIPYVVTVHDAWWLCQRQFMVRADSTYCFQTRIDLDLCEACIPNALHLRHRFRMLMQALDGAALVLSPSEPHRQLYIANGLRPERVLLHRNGIRLPGSGNRPRERGVLRFAYIGGSDRLKGCHLVRAAFESMPRADYELLLVDKTLNLGFSSMDASEWKAAGQIRVVPAYSQADMDEFFSAVDVLLFPSQWKETFGLVVAEALARDVWVIASDGGGAAELLVDGVNGTVLPMRSDPGPWRDAIEALLDDPQRLAGHRNPHRDRIITHDAQAEELRALLARVATVRR